MAGIRLALLGLSLKLVASGSPSANFSANFGSTMVLQRAPAKSSLYGFADGTSVTLTLSGADARQRQVSVQHTAPVVDGTWKVTLDPMHAGGSFKVDLSCADCSVSAGATTLTDLTFGDVWYCSGQSNMELSLKFTFERNETIKDIVAGKYSNVRAFLNPHITSPSPIFVSPGDTSSKGLGTGASPPMEWTWNKLATVSNATDVQGSALMEFR